MQSTTSTSSLAYDQIKCKSYLQLNKSKYHVYESRNMITWIGYVLNKFFSGGFWEERTVSIDNKQCTFLVKKGDAKAIDEMIISLARNKIAEVPNPKEGIVNDHACDKPDASQMDAAADCYEGLQLTQPQKDFLNQAAIDAIRMNSVGYYAEQLRTLHQYGTNDVTILKLYDKFLRGFTSTSADEEITLNGLHARALQQKPISLKQAVGTAEELLKKLQASTDETQKKKALYFAANLEKYKSANAKFLENDESLFAVKVSVLSNPQKFSFKNGSRPSYLEEAFQPKAGYTFDVTKEFFDYNSFKTDAKDFATADFANVYLGGGGLTHGAVQEEIQMLEFAEFFILMACFPSPIRNFSSALSTRNPNDESAFHNRNLPGQGSPDPLKIEGFTRFLHFTGYGATLFTKPVQPLESPQSNITIIAAAAPKIEKHQKFQFTVLEDTFNTIVAEMTLQKEHAADPENVCFASGRIGAGVFNNDPEAVYLLHRLAAEHVGIHLKLFAYDNDSALGTSCENSWNEIYKKFGVGTPECKSLTECIAIIAHQLIIKN